MFLAAKTIVEQEMKRRRTTNRSIVVGVVLLQSQQGEEMAKVLWNVRGGALVLFGKEKKMNGDVPKEFGRSRGS